MAPTRKTRDSAAKKDKKRRARPGNADALFKCLGNLCGEECDQDLQPVTDAASEYSDDDFEVRSTPTTKTGRVVKPKPKKVAGASAELPMPMKLGVQKAQQYICEALDFGLQSGYLSPKDTQGKVLVLSPELVQMTGAMRDQSLASGKRLAAKHNARRQPRKQRPAEGAEEPRRRRPATEGLEEPRDDEADVDEARARRHKRSRSRRGRHGRRRSGRSRSRSRSRSRRRARRRAGGRSRSADLEQGKTGETQQDAMEETVPGGKEGSRSNADGKDGEEGAGSLETGKRSKSQQRADERPAIEEKKHDEDDDGSTDDEDDKKK